MSWEDEDSMPDWFRDKNAAEIDKEKKNLPVSKKK